MRYVPSRRARRLLGLDHDRPFQPPRRTLTAAAVTAAAGGVALLLGSIAAGAIVACYTVLGLRMRRRARADRQRGRLRADALDLLAAAAAELRAGAPSRTLLLPDEEIDRQVHAARRLADGTGAPLADLLERLEAQCRAADRADATATAQAAGTQLTAILLAGLPVGGIGLGYLIGVDPLAILLHTPLGVGCALAAVLLQTAGLAWAQRLAKGAGAPAPGRAARRRLRRLRLRRRQQPASTRTRWLLALAAGAGTCLIIARPAGLGVGALAATGTWLLLGRQEPTAVRLEREQAVGELPWAADLVAAALRAGVPLDAAVLAVAAALPGPLATRLRRIGRSLRLGATPVEAWQHLSDLPMAARLTAAVERSSASGTALAGALHRCADDLRADAGFRRQATAQRNAVLVVLPLGLCFLPAFVLAGLVPVVLAVLGEVL